MRLLEEEHTLSRRRGKEERGALLKFFSSASVDLFFLRIKRRDLNQNLGKFIFPSSNEREHISSDAKKIMVATKKKKQQVNYKEDSSEDEEEESSDSEDDVPLAALKKKKPAAKTAAVKKKATPPAKKKTTAKKTPVKKKKAPVKKKKTKPTTETASKRKYEFTGQKRDPPDEEDSLRKFYVSLRAQRPDSIMAEVWLMEHGLLEDAKAHEKAHKAFMKRKTAPNTKSSIAGTVQPRRYLDEIENNTRALGKGKGEEKSEVKKETPSRKPTPPASAAKKPNEPSAMKEKPKVEDQNEESSDDDVPLAKLAAAQKA